MTLTNENEINNKFPLLMRFIGKLFNFASHLNLQNDNMKSFREIH